MIKNWIHNTNLRVARSPVGKWFRLEGSGHVRIPLHMLYSPFSISCVTCDSSGKRAMGADTVIAQREEGKLLLH